MHSHMGLNRWLMLNTFALTYLTSLPEKIKTTNRSSEMTYSRETVSLSPITGSGYICNPARVRSL